MKKIIDCFTFFNELDLLEIRLKYLYDVVDHFVIIEADTSHGGNKKPFIFQDNTDRFTPFKDKILYVPLKMKFFEEEKGVAWKRENYQRNCIETGLRELDLNKNDLILISDLDEIPNKKILEDFKKDYSKKPYEEKTQSYFYIILKNLLFHSHGNHKVQLKLLYYIFIKKYIPPVNFNMHNYYYYINYQEKNYLWPGLQCLEAKWLKLFSASEVRSFRFFPIRTINNSGWHFSFLGGKDMIKAKLKNFAHQEFNNSKIVSDEYIDFCINNGYSLFDYYRNPSAKPKFEKKEITDLPEDLQKIVIPYKNLILM